MTSKFFEADHFSQNEKNIAEQVIKETGFMPQSVLWRSTYFGNKLGAFHYSGQYEGVNAVLKVQGVKPETSEAEMISAFGLHNKSKIIRPPQVYVHLPWDEQKSREVLIMENAEGQKIIQSGALTNDSNLRHFYELYDEYRHNCVVEPWVKNTPLGETLNDRYTRLRKIATSLNPYPNPLSFPGDLELVDRGLEFVSGIWSEHSSVFCNRHFSVEDLIELPDGEVVLLSNLYWSWEPPLYDALFGFHWFFLTLERMDAVSPDQLTAERLKWLNTVRQTAEFKSFDQAELLLKAVLIERSCAALTIDGFVPDYRKHTTQNIISSIRHFLQEELKEV